MNSKGLNDVFFKFIFLNEKILFYKFVRIVGTGNCIVVTFVKIEQNFFSALFNRGNKMKMSVKIHHSIILS